MRTFQLHIKKQSGTAGRERERVKCCEKYGGLNEMPQSPMFEHSVDGVTLLEELHHPGVMFRD